MGDVLATVLLGRRETKVTLLRDSQCEGITESILRFVPVFPRENSVSHRVNRSLERWTNRPNPNLDDPPEAEEKGIGCCAYPTIPEYDPQDSPKEEDKVSDVVLNWRIVAWGLRLMGISTSRTSCPRWRRSRNWSSGSNS
ncbi:uncharacterized protein LOC140706707 [Pogona vitticeps]